MFRRNKSAYRAIEVVSLIAHNKKPMTIGQISSELDIPGSSAFELIYTLVETGIIVIDSEELKTFKLGLRSFEIGSRYLEDISFTKTSTKYLEKLSELTGETVFMDIEDKGQVTHIIKIEGSNTFRRTCSVGHRNFMHCTSVGKALLASYTIDNIKDVVDKKGLPKKTEYTITEFSKLIKDIELTRKRGYAVDDREDVIDGLCIGAPVYDHQNKAIAAISVSCHYSNMTGEKIEEFAKYTSEIALEISRELGYTGNKLYSDF